MKLGRDFAAGLASSLWSMAVALATVPFLIRYLGVEAYGLIGFGASLQSFLLVLDLGFAPTIGRQVARAAATEGIGGVRNLLRSLAWIYWSVAAAIGIALGLLAPVIARDWLNPGHLGVATVAGALALMAAQIAFRWPSGLYLCVLTGARQLVRASWISAAYYSAANLGALAVVAWWRPTIQAYFLWQAATGLAYTIALQYAAWRAVGGGRGARFDREEIRQVWRFTAGMSGVALASVLLTQLDKIVLSRLVSLEAFGYYMLAVLAASALYRITTPLFNAIYPRLSALVADGRVERLEQVYRIGTYLFSAIWFPTIIGLVACARPLLLLWTGNAEIAERSAPLLRLLAAGTGLHGAMFFPYALQLAFGETRLTLLIHLILVGLQIPLVVLLVLRFGVLGGAIAWLALYVFYVAIATPLTHRRMLTGVGRRWLFIDVGVPFAISASFCALAFLLLPRLGYSPLLQILGGGAMALAALLTSLLVCPHKPAEIRLALAD